MISPECFARTWVLQKTAEVGCRNPVMLEKTIIALQLLGHLAESSLPFQFRGGSSLLLRLSPIRRLGASPERHPRRAAPCVLRNLETSPMLQTPPAVDAAFRQLLAALEAEIAELRQLGSHHFHYDAAPRESQGLLRRAVDRARLRDELTRLYARWQENQPMPAPPSVDAGAPEPTNPVLIRHIKGISVPNAAERLGVSETRVRTWLEAGTLKGYRPTDGRWKITPADLMTFVRTHRDLI